MSKRIYVITRDLHLYLGLFLAPFLLVFSISVFFLVHPGMLAPNHTPGPPRLVTGLALPPDIESLDGRARVDALRTLLPALGVAGEIGFVRHIPKERRLLFPVSVPGRDTTVDLKLEAHAATVTPRDTGLWDGIVSLHKSPGQHLVNIRMNWFPMLLWRWFADGTVYLVLFITLSGVYLWAVLRAERTPGLALLAAGFLSFGGLLYAIIR